MIHAKKIRDAFGYLHEDELTRMFDLAFGKKRIVNIGAGSGTSGLVLREGSSNDSEIYTVDISSGGPFGGLVNERNAFRNTGYKLPVQILADSKKYGHVWDKGDIDLLFIDGDHSEIGVAGDIIAWVNHVKKDGLILFHDYGSNNWPYVKIVADKMQEEEGYKIVEIKNTLAIAVKL